MLLYKPDWKEAQERFKAWWEGELNEPLLQITSPRESVKEQYSWDYWYIVKNPHEPEKIVGEFERWCSRMFFGGEAYPNLWINLGAGVLGAFLGAEPKFTGDTVWFGASWNPRLQRSLEELQEVELDLNNKWWRIARELTRRIGELGLGKFIVGMTDIGGILDVIASLRGTVNLLRDMFHRPSMLERVIWRVLDLWHQCYDELYRLNPQEGTSAWMGLWCHGRWYPIQCDLAYMFSPKMFEKFVLPHIREQCVRLDYAIYHLDGVGQLPHLDMLLGIPELSGIQWVPGAAEEASGHHRGSPKWIPLYKKILRRGKKLVLWIPPESIRFIVRELGSKNLALQIFVETEREAKELLKQLRAL